MARRTGLMPAARVQTAQRVRRVAGRAGRRLREPFRSMRAMAAVASLSDAVAGLRLIDMTGGAGDILPHRSAMRLVASRAVVVPGRRARGFSLVAHDARLLRGERRRLM